MEIIANLRGIAHQSLQIAIQPGKLAYSRCDIGATPAEMLWAIGTQRAGISANVSTTGRWVVHEYSSFEARQSKT